jgi:acyl-[acyl-carrier-protein]-phospholipid O-acyltransferase/long-chain-fatty-acid--[acyl-carrier-protein] ligase
VLSARRHPFRFAMAGSQSPNVRFASALMKTIFLARRLRSAWAGQEKVGLLLPPSVPGALVNFAAMLLCKVPVNLNYTLSEQALASCIRQCDIKTVVTSKAFLEKVKLTVPCELVFLEERAAHPGAGEKLAAFFMAWLLPAGWLEWALGREKKVELDDLATVIFSSGGRAEGGHVEPLQHRIEHRAVGTSVQPGQA